MKKRGRQFLIGTGLAAALLFFAFRGVDAGALWASLRSASPLPLLGLVGASVLTYSIRAWRWQFLLQPLGRVGVPRLFSVTIMGFTSGFVIPRAQEVVRPLLVARSHRLRASAVFATIVLERLLDLATVLILFGLYLFVLPMPATQTRGTLLGTLRWTGAITGLSALGVLGILFLFHLHAERMLGFFDRWFGRLPGRLGKILSGGLRSFGEGLAVLQAPAPHLLVILGQSFLLWLNISAGFHFNHLAFGIAIPPHATFLLIAFLVVGVSIPTPGMVGGHHAFYILALNGALGVERDVAAAAGLVAHAMTNLPVLVLGLYFLAREGLNFGRVAEMTDGG